MGRTAFSAKLEQLGHDTYEQYLRTGHWQRTRQDVLERQGHKCYACAATKKLHVHHKTYARLGAERPADLVLLCESCHEKAHKLVRGRICPLAEAHRFVKKRLEDGPQPAKKPRKSKRPSKAEQRRAARAQQTRAQPAKKKPKTVKAPSKQETARALDREQRRAKQRRLEEKYAQRRAERRAAREAAT